VQKKWRERRPKSPYGTVGMTDEQHVQWFESRARQNPMWLVAAPFTEQGRKEITRYNRTMRGGV
jgi:hypothetical protein